LIRKRGRVGQGTGRGGEERETSEIGKKRGRTQRNDYSGGKREKVYTLGPKEHTKVSQDPHRKERHTQAEVEGKKKSLPGDRAGDGVNGRGIKGSPVRVLNKKSQRTENM